MSYSINKTVVFSSYSLLYHSIFWSEANQICITTPETIFIISPQFPDPKQNPPSTPLEIETLPLLHHRQEKEGFCYQDALDCLKNKTLQDSSFFMQSTVPLTYRMAMWTPFGCTQFDSCGLVVLYSDHKLALFQPRSDRMSRKWAPVQDLSKSMRACHDPSHVNMKFISLAPTYHVGWRTLLALGSVAGQVTLWQLEVDRITLLTSLTCSDAWITLLAWSPQARFLALADSAGSVQVLRHLDTTPLTLQTMESPYHLDPRLVTTLFWASKDLLAFAKANTVCFWNIMNNTTQEVALPPCTVISDMSVSADKMTLNVFTMDGQMHAIDLVEEPYAIDPLETRNFLALFRSKHAPATTNHEILPNEEDNEAANDNEDEDDHEHSFNHRGGHKSMYLGSTISPNGLFTVLVYGIYRPFELYFRTEKNSALFLDFLPTGAMTGFRDDFPLYALDLFTDTLSSLAIYPQSERPWTPRSLFWEWMCYFYGLDASIQSDPFRTSLQRFFTSITNPSLAVQQSEFFVSMHLREAAVGGGTALLQHFVSTLLLSLQSKFTTPSTLSADFASFLHRLVAVAQLLLDPSVIRVLEPVFPHTLASAQLDYVAHETCPICQTNVKMILENGIATGMCKQSHQWKRCCFTFELLPSTQVRECLGCTLTTACELAPSLESDLDPFISFLHRLQNISICYLCGDRFGWCGKPLPSINLDE